MKIKAYWNGDPTTFRNFESDEEADKLMRNLRLQGWKNVKRMMK